MAREESAQDSMAFLQRLRETVKISTARRAEPSSAFWAQQVGIRGYASHTVLYGNLYREPHSNSTCCPHPGRHMRCMVSGHRSESSASCSQHKLWLPSDSGLGVPVFGAASAMLAVIPCRVSRQRRPGFGGMGGMPLTCEVVANQSKR